MFLKDTINQYTLKYFLAILNSKLLYKYFLLKFSIMHISGGYLRFRKQFVEQLPIPEVDFLNKKEKAQHDKLVSLVDQMLEVQKKYHTAISEEDKKFHKQRIDVIDKQIDKLVYKLYELTEEEIKIVEG